MTNLTPHFTVEEMACPCCGKCDMAPYFMKAAEDFRTAVDHPLVVNSGFRCAKHNATLRDSSPTSCHLGGLAADWRWTEDDAAHKQLMLSAALRIFDGIGIGKTYLHTDLGGIKKIWIY
jgi:uncharacterized protein YcbK (DUF882 family)